MIGNAHKNNTINSEADYPIIGALISPRDQIDTEIQCKEMNNKSSKGKVNCITVNSVTVEQDAIPVVGWHDSNGRRKFGQSMA
jgi:hypothetical protein